MNPTHIDGLFLLLLWLVTVLVALFVGALISDVLFPWIKERQQIKRLKEMGEYPNWLKRQAD